MHDDWIRNGKTAIEHVTGNYRISVAYVGAHRVYSTWKRASGSWQPITVGGDTPAEIIDNLNLPKQQEIEIE